MENHLTKEEVLERAIRIVGRNRELSRRGFLSLAGGAVVSLSALGVWASQASAANTPLGTDIDPALSDILRYGTLAPSSHNAQMWAVRVLSDREIAVLFDKDHLLPQVDPANREALISLGTFIENMAAVAPAYGLEAVVTLPAGSLEPEEVSRIVFRDNSGSKVTGGVRVPVQERHTIRTPFLRRELAAQDLSALEAAGGGIHYFPLESPQGQYLKDAIILSIKQQTWNDPKQQELAGMIRFSPKEAEAKKDGLTPEMMGISGIAGWFVSTFFNRKTVMSQSFREQTVASATKQASNCAGFLLITSQDHSPASLIDTGRLLERMWCKATGLGVAVHPMSAPLEESPWKEELAAKLGLQDEVQMLLRTGYVQDYGHPVSRRREVTIVK